MSQEKVNRYKEEKANRKAILRKERIKSMVRKIILLVLSVALVIWVGYSAHYTWENNRPREMVTVNYDSFTAYLQTLVETEEPELDIEEIPLDNGEDDEEYDEENGDGEEAEDGEETEGDELEDEEDEEEE